MDLLDPISLLAMQLHLCLVILAFIRVSVAFVLDRVYTASGVAAASNPTFHSLDGGLNCLIQTRISVGWDVQFAYRGIFEQVYPETEQENAVRKSRGLI